MNTITRISDKILIESLKYINIDFVSGLRIQSDQSLSKIGSDYGGWVVPSSKLDSTSICYCAGVGEDISFDLGLIERFGCRVYAYDPTPKAAKYVQDTVQDNTYFKFYEIGLWEKEDILKFYAPANPEHVSHSILNIQKTDHYFEAPCKRLSAIMKDNGHSKIDLLKLDIEGAEYKVLDSIVEDQLDIDVICVEYDEAYNPIDKDYKQRIKNSVIKLHHYGYRLISADQKCNYTFIKSN